MRFRTYILVSAALFWFVLGSLFFYRSFWNIDSFNHKRGAITEYKIEYLDSSHNNKILTFKVSSSQKTYGLQRKKAANYQEILDQMVVGDTLDMYFSNWRTPRRQLHDQIFQLSINNKKIFSFADMVKKDRIIGSVLYSIALIFFVVAYWLNKEKWKFKGFKNNDDDLFAI
jgi:hypothetical protein